MVVLAPTATASICTRCKVPERIQSLAKMLFMLSQSMIVIIVQKFMIAERFNLWLPFMLDEGVL